MSSGKRRPSGERSWKAIADPTVRQQKILACTAHSGRRKQVWDGGTGTDNIAESNTAIATRRKAARPAAPQVVTYDSDRANPVM